MKKLLIGCVFIAAAFAIRASSGDTAKAISDNMNVPTYHFRDTVPKDTTRKDSFFSPSVAYRLQRDTLPRDTTKKDTTFQALAFNSR